MIIILQTGKIVKRFFYKNNKSLEMNKILNTQKKSINSKNKYYIDINEN